MIAEAVDWEVHRHKLEDQLWRLNNLYYIVNKDGKRVRFVMNSSQDALFFALWYRTVVLKARQRGFTTFLDIFGLDMCLFNPNTAVGIIAHTRDDAAKIFKTKVKFPYENLPASLRDTIAANSDKAQEYSFTNGSSISVGTSFRSGTLQFLHVSEMGKIAAKYPDKAKEIVTGAFEAVPLNGIIAVESTAEGRSGAFFNICDEAQKQQDSGKPLGNLDFRFFFEPWWKNSEYKLAANDLLVLPRLVAYFEELESKHKIMLTPKQKAWYVAKEKTLGDDMKREYPSTPCEAFEQSLEGAYFKKQIAQTRKDGRITKVPHKVGVPVRTWWDVGRDGTSIWFTQDVGLMVHVIDFYHRSGEDVSHFKQIMDEKAEKLNYYYTLCMWPHDMGDGVWAAGRRSDGKAKTKEDLAMEAGFKGEVLPRMAAKADGIGAARAFFSLCIFDEERCDNGLKALEAFRKIWDDRLGCWKEQPLHDWASHPADAFMQLALYHESAVVSAASVAKAKPVQKRSAGGWT